MSRAIDDAGLAIIKNAESCRLLAYLPTQHDVWTIGWGHTGPEVVQGLTCTQDQADAWLVSDITWAEDMVDNDVTVAMSDNQFAALVSFVFNTGPTAFKDSTMLRLLNTGDYNGAAGQFGRWIHQAGKVLPGLITRRAAEMALFNTP